LPGEFWAVDFDDIGTADSTLLLYKGVWNASTRDVDWTIAHFLPLPLNFDGTSTYEITPVIAFDPTGMYGWVGTSADVMPSSNLVYEPVFYRTVDGGATWTGPMYVNLGTLSSVTSSLDPNSSGIPTTSFESDMVVDMNGALHYAIVIGS